MPVGGKSGGAGRRRGDLDCRDPYVGAIKTDTQHSHTDDTPIDAPLKETAMFLRHHSFKILGSAALMLAAASSFASAQSRSIGSDSSDLDLASNAGRAVLD